MFPEIPDFSAKYLQFFFFKYLENVLIILNMKYLASFHKYYSKNTKNSRSSKKVTQISAILLNIISHIAYIL